MLATMDQLVLLSEEKAIDCWFNARNYRWFVRLLIVLFIIAAWQLSQLTLDFHIALMPMTANLILLVGCFGLFLSRHHLQRTFQALLVFFLFFQLTLMVLGRENLQGLSIWLSIYPIIFLFFRLKPSANLALFGWLVVLTILDGFLPGGTPQGASFGSMVAINLMAVLCLIIAILLRSMNQRRFVAVWRIECNNRDRIRMKQELDHAREIQLSMLPPGRAEIANLDIACTSIPATEVGGDYFDYFQLSDSELMLVIGDVSGHGVASGLVLSGVRSCLYLFEDKLPAPAELLGQLNRMLKKTTDKRMFMTFLAVRFDTRHAKLTFSMAGHQPLLHYCHQKGTLTEIPSPALPLGAVMGTQYQEHSVQFQYGDVFLFYTDGLIDACNEADHEYGLQQLKESFQHVAAGGNSAEKIREVLMTNVHLFIGSAVQLDDMSLVVVRTHPVD